MVNESVFNFDLFKFTQPDVATDYHTGQHGPRRATLGLQSRVLLREMTCPSPQAG